MNDGGVWIELTAMEQKLAQAVARRRTEHDRASGATATVYGGRSHDEHELESVGGEIAFCKAFNCWPDLDTEHFGDWDAVLEDGRTVDVKTTARQQGRLLVKDKTRNGAARPSLFALMVGEFPRYRFAGWITARELLTPRRLDASLPHPAYAAKQSELFGS